MNYRLRDYHIWVDCFSSLSAELLPDSNSLFIFIDSLLTEEETVFLKEVCLMLNTAGINIIFPCPSFLFLSDFISLIEFNGMDFLMNRIFLLCTKENSGPKNININQILVKNSSGKIIEQTEAMLAAVYRLNLKAAFFVFKCKRTEDFQKFLNLAESFEEAVFVLPQSPFDPDCRGNIEALKRGGIPVFTASDFALILKEFFNA